MNPAYLSGALASATIPMGPIVEPQQAWAVILTALAVSCGILWLLTRGVASGPPEDHPYDAVRAGQHPTPRAGRQRRPPLQPLAHHGSRAA
jgi:hypothetical protein